MPRYCITIRHVRRATAWMLLLLSCAVGGGCTLIWPEPEPQRPATIQEWLKQERPGTKPSK